MIFHVALNGKDSNDGLSAASPLPGIAAAYSRLLMEYRKGVVGLDSKILVHGGDYRLAKPEVLSGNVPVEIAPFENDKVVFSGGIAVTGWKKTTVNGRICFRAPVPENVTELPFFYVNGKAAQPARWPKKDWFRVTDEREGFTTGPEDCDNFHVAKGDFNPKWYDPQNIAIKMIHLWCEETTKVQSFDEKELKITTASTIRYKTKKSNTEYAFFNVKEALSEPDEFYFDRLRHEVLYVSKNGKAPSDAVIPQPGVLLRIDSAANITMHGFTFRFGGGKLPQCKMGFDLFDPLCPEINKTCTDVSAKVVQRSKPEYQSGQAAVHVPGVIFIDNSTDCEIRDCEICECGWAGICVYTSSQRLRFINNHIHHMGSGGILICGAGFQDAEKDPSLQVCKIVIQKNHIHDCGLFYYSAVGITVQHAWGCLIEDNHIHDLYYSGISCGFIWGYAHSMTHDIRIHRNHIHDLGKGLLSDMGGIYLLGSQPGTRVWENIIHDVVNRYYGGWGLYTDEGSSHIVMERNIVYDCACESFHQHYGRENIVRFNIFAFAKENGVAVTRDWTNGYECPGEPHSIAVSFINNVIVTDNTSVINVSYADVLVKGQRIYSDGNIIYDVSGKKNIPFGNFHNPEKKVSRKEWQELGYDRHSVFANPGFRNVKKRDFRLKKDSILFEFGFKDIPEL